MDIATVPHKVVAGIQSDSLREALNKHLAFSRRSTVEQKRDKITAVILRHAQSLGDREGT